MPAVFVALALAAFLLVGCSSHHSARAKAMRVLNGRTELPNLRLLGDRRPRTLAFATSNVGLLSTDGGRLFATRNGGDTWTPLPARIRLDALRFASLRRAFGTVSGCRRHRCTVRLVETADGGGRWQDDGVIERYRGNPDYSPAGADTIFLDRLHGFRLGDHGLLASHDGGRSWSTVFDRCGDYPGGFDFLDARRGFVMCGSQPATIEMLKTLYATTDGGATWHEVERSHLSIRSRRRGDIPTQGHLAGIRFRNRRDAIMIVHRAGLDLTHDGGHHWGSILGVETELFVNDVDWPARSRIYALLFRGQVVRSDDGGRHWLGIVPHSASPPSGPTAFRNARDGIGIGRNDWAWDPRAVLTTSDGGRTWSRRGELPPIDNAIQVTLEGGHGVWVTGYKSGAPALFRSSDLGRTWAVVRVPTKTFATISIPRRGLVYLTNERGVLYRSRDDGASWHRVANARRDFRDFALVSPTEAYALDHSPSRESARLYRSQDGGRSWQLVPVRTPLRLTSFTTWGRHLWLLGTRCPPGAAGERLLERQPDCPGGILRSPDGGQSWELVRLNMVPGFNGIAFSSDRDGFAGDGTNGFYRTRDGGRTWRYLYPPPID